MLTVIRSAAVLLATAGSVTADDPIAHRPLTPRQAAEGWVMLFDDRTTFGWTVDGEAKVTDDGLVLGGTKETVATTDAAFGGYGQVVVIFRRFGKGIPVASWQEGHQNLADTVPNEEVVSRAELYGRPDRSGPIRVRVPAGTRLELRGAFYKPGGTTPLFNGKDLTGWKRYTGDPKREKSKFEVTPAGELHLTDGSGDLQTEKTFADFLLQLECKTNGPGLNSGVFFRGLPGQYQQGYEAQIHNRFKDGDRTKPTDFGTGAIYRRIPARKVVANDGEWFTLTVLANGPHLATWVNGYPTVSWTDDRKPAENARQGLYTKAGVISLQGHDPTTDLLFRNIKIAEMERGKR
ncbi:MAG: DUF1080 domain-containing protein [Gemmataceae bacterium]